MVLLFTSTMFYCVRILCGGSQSNRKIGSSKNEEHKKMVLTVVNVLEYFFSILLQNITVISVLTSFLLLFLVL